MRRERFLAGAAGLVLAPGAFARRLGGTPTALVTADLESHVVAVDLSTGRVLKRIRTLADPRAIDSARQTVAVVVHTSEGALSILDGPSLRVTGIVRGFAEPRYAALSRTGRYAYVTDSARGELATVDLARGRIVHRLELGGAARHLSLHPSQRLLWTSLGNVAARVAVVDLRDADRPRAATVVRPPFHAHDVGFAPGGKRVWVTGGASRQAAIYDPRTRELQRVLRADAAPQHVTFTRHLAYVTSGDDGLLRVHSLGGRLLRTERIPHGSYNVQQDWERVLTPSLSQGTLCVADRNGRVVRRLRVARSSHDACFVVSA